MFTNLIESSSHTKEYKRRIVPAFHGATYVVLFVVAGVASVYAYDAHATKPPAVISKVVTTRAIFLPKPVYPQIAQRLHIHGTVNVQVVVDVDGKVISAKALSGIALLVAEAQKAALQARFSPTLRAKASGVITYNFALN